VYKPLVEVIETKEGSNFIYISQGSLVNDSLNLN
jgi:hypothetical protein